MIWQIKTFNELTTHELFEILKLRSDVFVVEQNCVYPDLDEKDRHSQTHHVMLLDDHNRLMGYSRVLAPGQSYPEASIGRVVINPDNRGNGLAQRLMQKSIAVVQQQWPDTAIQIGAQEYLTQFYQNMGFQPISEMYLEDGIPHRDMLYLTT
ncbi:GNAT family N-acetyltransferase [Parashewanella spongiae]|uniref:Protein ElaA n=1 Tax=Parashewanella spongiae TaxID=342950 RepID=A0A3A6UJM2_9GAMM|nr:GNAT family N-acetyltransferase [Parashewanella spongiae]MCL1077203.1 GNAT family N-acetyltransferase [Parashewanella spongiae]RJY19356.1 GNAT family N-acetyltransferase [Parashewanella spongiae]